MSLSRRSFVKALSAAAVASANASAARAEEYRRIDVYPQPNDNDVRQLAARALDAAKAAGASYADVRFTRTRTEQIGIFGPGQWSMLTDDEQGAIGVRALTDGAWGFAASPLWTNDEAARLGRDAATQAKYNSRGRKRKIEMGSPPPVVTGEWVMPVKRDPFTVPLSEKLEVMWALAESATRLDVRADVASYGLLHHKRQEKTLASTEGSFISQTRFLSHPHFQVFASDNRGAGQARTFDRLQPSSAGWEAMLVPGLAAALPEAIEEAVRKLEAERVNPGRYDVVVDALAMAQIVAHTIGVAAELDRVLGYEANAGGTSYLGPVEEMLGKFALGPRFLNVAANRSAVGGTATIKWDDEAVEPSSYAVIKDGVLVSYHTNRELAASQSAKSTGSASCESAAGFTLLQPPNIEMLPGTDNTSLDDLVKSLDHGLVVLGGAPLPGGRGIVSLDRQQLNGEMSGGTIYEVRKGKRTGYVRNAELLFRSPDLWKSLKAIGGKGSQVFTASGVSKGQPSQQLSFGAAAVPGLFSGVAVTDITRKA
jgi:TldD protein